MRRKKIASDVQHRYRVTSGIPIPPLSPSSRYPLKRMKVGDSFGFPASEANKVRNAVSSYRAAGAKSVRFTVRKESPKRCRCWRIA